MGPKIVGFAHTGPLELFCRYGREQPIKKILSFKFAQVERIYIKTKGERIVRSLCEKL